MVFVCDLFWVQEMHLLPGEVLCWWLSALSPFVDSNTVFFGLVSSPWKRWTDWLYSTSHLLPPLDFDSNPAFSHRLNQVSSLMVRLSLRPWIQSWHWSSPGFSSETKPSLIIGGEVLPHPLRDQTESHRCTKVLHISSDTEQVLSLVVRFSLSQHPQRLNQVSSLIVKFSCACWVRWGGFLVEKSWALSISVG